MNLTEMKSYIDQRIDEVYCTSASYTTALEGKANASYVDELNYDFSNKIESVNSGVSSIWADLSDIYQRLEALEEAVRRLQQPNPTTIESLL